LNPCTLNCVRHVRIHSNQTNILVQYGITYLVISELDGGQCRQIIKNKIFTGTSSVSYYYCT